MGGKYALLVASYAYEDEGLRPLTAPAHDAEALAEVLRDPDIAGFEVTTLVNRPHSEVGPAIGDFLSDRLGDDLTLLYFTGHGIKDRDGRLLLATVNTRLSNRTFTSVAAEQIEQAMNDCASQQQVLILDCCYSGAFPGSRLAKGGPDADMLETFRGKGRTVLTASDVAEHAFESDGAEGGANRSIFTKYLVQGLRDGSADRDEDGEITLDELYAYVHDMVVAEEPRQRPKRKDNIAGRTVIAQNTNWRLPAQLRNALAGELAAERLWAVERLASLQSTGSATVRARAAEQLRLMVDDDSRKVSAAAAAALGETTGPPPAARPHRAEIQRLLDRATEERDSGEIEPAEDHFWTALDLAIQHRVRSKEGWAWDGLGSCRFRVRDYETATRYFVRAERIADEVGDTTLKAWCLCNVGDVRRERGATAEAKEFYERAIAVVGASAHGAAGWALNKLGKLAFAAHDVDQARDHFEAAAWHGAELENHSLEGWSLIHLAECEEAAGDPERAHAHYLEAARVGRGLQPRWIAEAAARGLARLGDPRHRGAHA